MESIQSFCSHTLSDIGWIEFIVSNNNQLQDHRGQGDKGNVPRDNVPKVVVVDIGVRLLNGLVDGVVGKLRKNRQ